MDEKYKKECQQAKLTAMSDLEQMYTGACDAADVIGPTRYGEIAEAMMKGNPEGLTELETSFVKIVAYIGFKEVWLKMGERHGHI